MYSALQQQCLSLLGIELYQLKRNETADSDCSNTNNMLSWQQVPKPWLDDLFTLFPKMQISEQHLQLNDNLVWSLSNQKTVKLTDSSLCTPWPHLLSVAQKKQIWQQLRKYQAPCHD